MRVLRFAALFYGAYAIIMIALHPTFIYPFFEDDLVLEGFARVELTGDDGTSVFVQEAEGEGPVVLYFMGNTGALLFFNAPLQDHRLAGRHVIAMEYRGGGGRPGRPSEAVLKADALLATDWALAKEKPLVVQGYSLGTGLAAHVAARRAVAQVLLIAPYDKLCRLMAQRAYLPACLLPFVQRWDVLPDASKISAPVTILHGDADRIVPAASSEPLAAVYSNAERVVLPKGTHFNQMAFPAARVVVQGVFERITKE